MRCGLAAGREETGPSAAGPRGCTSVDDENLERPMSLPELGLDLPATRLRCLDLVRGDATDSIACEAVQADDP